MSGKQSKALIGLAIPLLLAVLIAIVAQQTLRKARLGKSGSQLRWHIQMLFVYAENHDDTLPSAEMWPEVMLESGLLTSDDLESSFKDAPGPAYIYLEGAQLWDADQIIMYENPEHWNDVVLTGFADGRVEYLSHEEFQRLLAEQTAESP